MSMSPFLKAELVNHAMARAYISLHTADPGPTGGNEVTGSGYSRVSAAFTPSVDGAASNAGEIEFRRMPTARFSFEGIWDAPVGGNFLWGAWLGETQEVQAGDSFVIDPNSISVKLT